MPDDQAEIVNKMREMLTKFTVIWTCANVQTMSKTVWQKGIPLDEATAARLRSLGRERGEREAAKLLGISLTAFVRAAAGLGLRQGTIFMIHNALASVEQPSRVA